MVTMALKMYSLAPEGQITCTQHHSVCPLGGASTEPFFYSEAVTSLFSEQADIRKSNF